MQLRCSYCQMMFALSRDEMLAALQRMSEEKLQYYDAHCPKCRRANRVERARMERFFPGWKEAIKAMAKEAAVAATEPTPASKPVIASAVAAPPREKKTAPGPKSAPPSPQGKKPAAPAKKKIAPPKKGTAAAKPAASRGKAPVARAKAPSRATPSPKGKKPATPTKKPAPAATSSPKVAPSPRGKKPATSKKK